MYYVDIGQKLGDGYKVAQKYEFDFTGRLNEQAWGDLVKIVGNKIVGDYIHFMA